MDQMPDRKTKTVFQTTDLVELIEDGLAVFSSMSQVKNINIRFAPPEKIEVNTDMDMVKQSCATC